MQRALKLDAAFDVIVFPLKIGKRFAHLITHALKNVALAARLTEANLFTIDEFRILAVNTHETIAQVHYSFAVLFTPLFSGRA